MKRSAFRLWTTAMCCIAFPPSLCAYDEAGHHAIVYAIARTAGYSVKDAALIADASQSLDDNDATTAFSFSKLWDDFKSHGVNYKEYSYVKNGQAFHALASTSNRQLIEKMQIERMNELERSGMDATKKQRLKLIFLGEYLHFVADEVVHPASTTFSGHAWEVHTPDRPESDEQKLKKMMLTVQDKLIDYKKNGTISAVTNWEKIDQKVKETTQLPDQLQKIEKVILDTWKPDAVENLSKPGGSIIDYTSNYDNEKEASIIAKLRNELVNMNLPGKEKMELPPHQKLFLNANGNPPDINDLQYVEYDFNRRACAIADVQYERDRIIENELVTDAEKLNKFMLESIGGIALDPNLEIKGDIGKPIKISLSENGIILITSKGQFILDNINPQSFATIMRTVAAGQIPYISIGTVPSDKNGYARVSYASTLEGTWEGNMLYRADIQFKAVFANYPFGTGYALNRPGDPLFGGFPGFGGESLRFWIASNGIVINAADGHLKMERSGMQILSETMLQKQVTEDSKMNVYTRHLTDNWDEITKQLPEFKEVEKLALVTALVNWVKKNKIPIDDILWFIKPRGAYTPEYSSYILTKNQETPIDITGGVTLMPEFKDKGLAYNIQFGIIKKINDYENKFGKGWGRFIFSAIAVCMLALCIFIPSFIFMLLANWALRPAAKRITFKIAIKNTSILLLSAAALTFIISPLTFGNSISDFDKKLLALLFTVVACPVLFFAWAKYRYHQLNSLYLYLQKNKFKKRTMTFFCCLFPLFNAFLFNAIATITASVSGVVPNTRTMAMLDMEIIPMKTFFLANPVTVFNDGNYMIPFVNPQENRPFTFRPLTGNEMDQLNNGRVKVGADTVLLENLKPVLWPENFPKGSNLNIYSIGGKPPY